MANEEMKNQIGSPENMLEKRDQKKNVLVLSLSTFPKVLSNNSYKYSLNEKQIEVNGFYQLEPVPQILRKLHGDHSIDKVIMLCQMGKGDDRKPLVCKPETITIQHPPKAGEEGWEEKREISAIEFFKERIKECVISEDAFIPVQIDPANPADGIREVVEEIRNVPREELRLYMDTHGGLRGIQRVLEAIISLLKFERIEIEEIFGLEKKDNSDWTVFSEKENFKIFDFVAGMNEFHYSGRIDSLHSFIDEQDDLTKAIAETAEGIQWCDVSGFSTGIRDIQNIYSQTNGKTEETTTNGYLSIFHNHIKDDYDKLLGTHMVSDEVKWCMRKQFYQQALTLIESRISKELLEKGYIRINLPATTYEGETGYYKVSKNGVVFAVSLNELWNGLINGRFSDLKHGNELTILSDDQIQYKKTIYSLDKVGFTLLKSQCKTIQGNSNTINIINCGEDKIEILCDSSINKLGYLHKAIKNIRNRANHAEVFRYTKKEIVQIIASYLEILDSLKTPIEEIQLLELPEISVPDYIIKEKLETFARMAVYVFRKKAYPNNKVKREDLYDDIENIFCGNLPRKKDIIPSGKETVKALLLKYYPDLFKEVIEQDSSEGLFQYSGIV